jgi:hypothetical protein
MIKKLHVFVALLFFVQATLAQNEENKLYYHKGGNPTPNGPIAGGPNSAGFSGTGSNIDVVYHRIWWRLNPDSASKGIKGIVTTYFKTLSANVSVISFDLNSSAFSLANVTATYHGSACTRTLTTNKLTITLPAPAPIVASGTLDSVVINYNGVPPGVVGQAEGFQKKSWTGANTGTTGNFIYTLSESYEDRDWWPCKADMQDKIDSMDITVNVPNTFWVASNGLLIDSTILGANRQFVYRTRYPIASYLVTLGIADYVRYYRSPVNIGGTNVPVMYYFLKGKPAGDYTTLVNAYDKGSLELAAFSNKYGDYPFKNEKHGYYEFGWGGGMEHQSFSAMGGGTTQLNYSVAVLSDWGVVAHELMHQWFGDKVTFATWNHLWLAEGFARYGEALAAELVPSLGKNAGTVRKGFQTAAFAASLDTASVFVPNSSITTSDILWTSTYGTSVYEKGAMIVAMLRAMSGDTKYFQTMQNYLNSPGLAYKSATTDSLKNHFNATLGVDLTSFFNDYVYGKGIPTNNIKWNNTTNKIYVGVSSQTRSAAAAISGTTYFHGPVVLHITNAASGWTKDTTVVFYDWGGGNLSYAGNGIGAPIAGNQLSYTLSFTPTNVFFDDSARTLSKGSIAKTLLIVLATKVQNFTASKTGSGNETNLSLESTDQITKVELQKSANGIDFISAGEMNLISAAGQKYNYQLTDINPFAASTYYRAKIYTAGKEELTSVVLIKSAEIKGITISPNPADENVNVTFNNPLQEETAVTLLSAEGKRILEVKTSNNYIHFDTGNLANGIYMIKIMQQGKISETQKLLIRH